MRTQPTSSAGTGRRTRRTETGRGERVVPGVWRLRLPLPLTGVPHCNAWALARGDGIVLVDCGMASRGSMRDLERALEQVGLALEDVRLLVCTHAHIDHCGQASAVQERAGCELWLHPRHEHLTASLGDREAALIRRIEIARQSGVPEAPLQEWAEGRREQGTGMSGPFVVARDLLPGVAIETDLGAWDVIETPGHAPSHVVLHQPQHRLLLSGDHVLGRISLYFDHGWTPDPVAEFLRSLDVVDTLDVRLTLAGHARPFTDLRGHVEGSRALVRERLAAVAGALEARGQATAFELLPTVYGERLMPETAAWLLTKMLCYLEHLEANGRVCQVDGEPVRWAAA
jgi:glyoxylase-like metal-dependent hydrolase (beta-lactamase superfamily II)